jgi:DNA polymerase III epsilon subunit-like protein|tara:strand:+ start:872 stop:1462 length:591 start_codon:yes stop_codon:yes gene_type:complete
MNIVLFDTEFFSLSKKKSSIKNLKKYQNLLFPEIMQLGAYKYSNFFFNKKPKKINIFFKTQQKIPERIKNLTGINEKILKSKGKDFNKNIYSFFNLIDKKSIVFSNGNDFEVIKLNMRYNNLDEINKIITFVDLRKVIGNIDTEKRYLKYSYKKIKLHNALNDCFVLKLSIDEFIKTYGKDAFIKIVNKKKKLIKL